MKRLLLPVILVAFLSSLCSCRTIREVEIRYDTVVQTDTTEVYVHDTTKVTEVRVDSVDRLVEKITYVDSNGVWHEREKETLHHYIFMQSEEYKIKESDYKSKISELEKRLAEEKKFEYVEKKLNWFQKMEIYGFWVLLAAVAVIAFLFARKKWVDMLNEIYN